MDLNDLKKEFLNLLDHPEVQSKLQFLHDWKPDSWAIFYLLVAFVVGFLIGRRYQRYKAQSTSSNKYIYDSYQNGGEAYLSSILMSNFKPPNYHLMNHITLELTDGTTQIDHILVSRFGVFVIETKDHSGLIFANLKLARWTQNLFGHSYKFQNPIHQNSRHVRAVQNLLDFLPNEAIKPVVVFTGDVKFQTEVPVGVYTQNNISSYLREQSVEIISLNRLQFIVGRIETARLAISKQTDIEHIESLHHRHGNL